MSDEARDNAAPIALVVPGMAVVDRHGKRVGTVKAVRMGDPEAITTEGQVETAPGLIGLGGPVDVKPEVPPSFAARLLRTGYLKIDRPGLLSGDAYVPATEVAAVHHGTVRLSVDCNSLVAATD